MLNILPLCQTMTMMPGFGAIRNYQGVVKHPESPSPAQEGKEEGAGRRKETAHFTERTAEATQISAGYGGPMGDLEVPEVH